MIRRDRLAIAAVVGLTAALAATAQEPKLKYPETKKVDHTDDYHGTKVADPYRWLEDDVRKSQGRRRLGRGPEQGHLRRTSKSIPERERDQEAAHRPVELREDTPPRSRTAAGTSSPRTTACRTRPSSTCRTRSTASRECCSTRTRWSQGRHRRPGRPGGQRRRQATSPTASPRPARDWNTWKVLDVATGKPLDDELKWVKFSGASWTQGRQGLLLQPLPRAEEGRRRSRA